MLKMYLKKRTINTRVHLTCCPRRLSKWHVGVVGPVTPQTSLVYFPTWMENLDESLLINNLSIPGSRLENCYCLYFFS